MVRTSLWGRRIFCRCKGPRGWLAFAEGGGGSYSPKGMSETVERDGGSSWQSCPRTCCRVFHILQSARQFYSLTLMTQDERWLARYNEVMDFMERERRNPSKHRLEEHDMLNWLKANRKKINAGELKKERVEMYKVLLEAGEKVRRVNQWGLGMCTISPY